MVEIKSGNLAQAERLHELTKELKEAKISYQNSLNELTKENAVKQTKLEKQTTAISLLNGQIRAKDALLAKSSGVPQQLQELNRKMSEIDRKAIEQDRKAIEQDRKTNEIDRKVSEILAHIAM